MRTGCRLGRDSGAHIISEFLEILIHDLVLDNGKTTRTRLQKGSRFSRDVFTNCIERGIKCLEPLVLVASSFPGCCDFEHELGGTPGLLRRAEGQRARLREGAGQPTEVCADQTTTPTRLQPGRPLG